MPRIFEILHDGKESNFTVTKISRSKLYGSKHRIPVDGQGNECSRASLTRDGMYVLPTGGTAMLYLNEQDDVVERDQLRAIAIDGEAIEPGGSVLNVVLQVGHAVQAADLLECTITHAYALEPVFIAPGLNTLLTQGKILRVPFPNHAGQGCRQSFLFGNDAGYFLLIGEQNGFEFIGLSEADLSPPDIGEDGYDMEDNIDFGMI